MWQSGVPQVVMVSGGLARLRALESRESMRCMGSARKAASMASRVRTEEIRGIVNYGI